MPNVLIGHCSKSKVFDNWTGSYIVSLSLLRVLSNLPHSQKHFFPFKRSLTFTLMYQRATWGYISCTLQPGIEPPTFPLLEDLLYPCFTEFLFHTVNWLSSLFCLHGLKRHHCITSPATLEAHITDRFHSIPPLPGFDRNLVKHTYLW